jgi:RsiW-degrading membrane proteinase PrsW (M82 family)
VQLIVLGSFARVAGTRIVLSAIAVGLFACAPLAVLLQTVWIRTAASATGVYIGSVVRTASYTVDPFMEEILKLLPLLMLLRMPAVRRQWSVTDCVLIAAATGSGFGLAESLYRLGSAPDQANWIGGGWIVGINISLPVVPSVATSLTAWLPSSLSNPGSTINLHLAWSALGGLGVGLLLRLRGSVRWLLTAAVLLYIGVDHAANNAQVNSVGGSLVAVFGRLRQYLGLLPIAALAIAWWLDRRDWRRTGHWLEPMLASEQSCRPRALGTLRSALSRPPTSLSTVCEFVRLRRACANARREGHGATDLAPIVMSVRDRIESTILHANEPDVQSFFERWSRWVRRPSLVIWLLLMLPSFCWFIVAGIPAANGSCL